MKKILTIIGSTRANSSNLNLIKKLEALTKDVFEISYYNGLTHLPHFNPDLDNTNPPKDVQEFREQIKQADGLIFVHPNTCLVYRAV